jgi:formylglycine-generating enzyme required for sulfatase activity
LCSTAEWVDACQGSGKRKRTYPYGPKLDGTACNVEHSSHPVLLLAGGRHKTDSFTLNDPRINQLGGTVAPTGAFEHCVTPEGVHDLVGNLLEWTRGERPLLMGGHYLDATENGDGCGYVTVRHGPEYHDFTTGFRCCRKPEQAPRRLSLVSEPFRQTAQGAASPALRAGRRRVPGGHGARGRNALRAPAPTLQALVGCAR